MNNTMLSAQVNGIILNTCIDCIYRGRCDEEIYISRGEDCRLKVTEKVTEKDTGNADI